MAQTDSSQADAAPKGIGGWLILPLIHLIYGPIFSVWLLAHAVSQRIADHPEHRPLAIILAAVVVSLPYLVFLVLCLVRFLQERQIVPRLMTVFYGFNAAILVLLIAVPGLVPMHALAQGAVTMHPVALLLSLVMNAVWIAYFHSSVRVKNTFVAAPPPRIVTGQLSGLGGWLLVVFAVAALWSILLLGIVHSPFTLAQRLQWSMQHGTIYIYRLGASVMLSAVGIYGIVCALRRQPTTRPLMIGYSALSLLYTIVFTILPNPHALKGAAVIASVWIAIGLYFWTSRRVKNTFVR